MNELGKKVKEVRKANKLSQQAFAEMLGYSHKSVINKIESGQRDMSYEKILLMVKLFNLDIKDIDDMTPKKKSKPKKIKKEKKLIVYVHGYHGNNERVEFMKSFLPRYDVKGLDFGDDEPWNIAKRIVPQFEEMIKGYDEVVVVAMSLGAFLTMEYLYPYCSSIKKAFFLSPLTDMYQYIFDTMNQYHITEKKLKEQKTIKLDNGMTLSYDFYIHTMVDPDKWNVKTHVLYGSLDEMIYLESVADFVATHDATLVIKDGAHHRFNEESDKEFFKKWLLENI